MPIFRGKQFVSSASDYKDSVRVALRSNLNLSANVTVIDGVTLNDKDRVLLAGQTLASQNGIYSWLSTTSRLTRATDADSGIELSAGTRLYVEDGNTHAKTTWVLITTGSISVGSTSLIFAKENRLGPVDNSGTYGAANKTLTITLDETGVINSISAVDIDVDGGSY
jgi:phage-related tail fiber protein